MPHKSTTRNRRTARYQLLEERRLLAGDIRVFENVHLYIRGDRADNQFEIVAEGDQLKINGLEGTTINGQDSFTVAGARASESGVTFEGGLRTHLGPGNDDFRIKDAQFEAMSLIYGGTGDDKVDVLDSNFMDKLTIQTFDGDDTIFTTGSHFEDTFRAMTLDGEDTVTMIDSMLAGDSIVVTGEHSDSVHSEANHYMGEVNLVLPQNGADTVELNNPVVGEHQLGVFLGNGNDVISGNLMEANVGGTIKIGGQAGIDTVEEMTMSDEAGSNVSMATIEEMQVFDGGVFGAANVLAGNDSYYRDTIGNQRYASPVILNSTQTIGSVEWTGTYARDAVPGFDPGIGDSGDSFVVEIFEDAGDGAPDSSTGVRFELGSANRVNSGETATQQVTINTTFEYPIYEYSGEIDFTMFAGKQYWVSIYTIIDDAEFDQQNLWGWGYAANADFLSEAVMTQGFDPSDGTVDKDWRYISDDGPKPDIQALIDFDFRLRT